MNGILNLYKPSGITSHTAVSIVKSIFGAKKAGHTGTLDPMACGVLPILIGNAVKLSEYMICDCKSYRTCLKLGITTDTEDTTGTILTTNNNIPHSDAIRDAVMSFVGEYFQVPPMYSAIKVGGKKLYELARKGQKIEREARRVVIESIQIHDIGNDFCDFSVSCSKGTYIRTLCSDIGEKLGCGGAMQSLERLNVSGFDLKDSITLESLRQMSTQQLENCLVSVESFFDGLEKVRLNQFFSSLALNGAYIFLSKINRDFPVGQKVLLYTHEGTFFALGEVRLLDQQKIIKPIKMFHCV